MTTATVNHATKENKSFFTGNFSEDTELMGFDGRNARPTRWTLSVTEYFKNGSDTVDRKLFSIFVEAPVSKDPKISVATFQGTFAYPSFLNIHDRDFGYNVAGLVSDIPDHVLDAIEAATGVDLTEAR